DLRKRLEVVDDEDDDVFIEATPLARKISTFKIHTGTIGECDKTSSRRRK
nr:hypothetical protein [Tanacetum cinerariifolium]